MSAASIRCWICRPEGPAAVNLGNDLRMNMRFRSLGSLHSAPGLWGKGGQGLRGCLLIKSFHVSLFGATPDDMRVWQAFSF